METICSWSEIDLLKKETLWQHVQAIQRKCKKRLLLEEDVQSGEFLLVCKAALCFCEKYGLDKGNIEVYQDGGAVNKSYERYTSETSALTFDGESVKVGRTCSRKVAFGDFGILYCRIRVSGHPARKVLKAEGWVEGRKMYAWISSIEDAKNLISHISQPKPTDVVLGGKLSGPKPTDAVLGGKREKIEA